MKAFKWYIAYTYPKAERKVKRLVDNMGWEVFLPTQKEKRIWSDRIKFIEAPIFPNYVFVKTFETSLPVLRNLEGIARFISFGGKYATIKEGEIAILKNLMNRKERIQLIPVINKLGEQIRVTAGPFEGFCGVVVRRDGANHLMIQLEGIRQNIAVSLPASYLAVSNTRA